MNLSKRKIIGLMATTAAIAAGPAAGSALANFSVSEATTTEGGNLAVTITATCENGFLGPCIDEKFYYRLDDGTAKAGSDFEGFGDTLFYLTSFQPRGTVSRTIEIPTIDDSIDEPDEEHATLHVSHAGKFGPAERDADMTIRDNDAEPEINSVTGPSTINEGTNETRSVPYVLHLSAPSEKSITRSYSTQDGTAKAGSDYVANTGTVTFAPGETTKQVDVSLITDSVFEDDETFSFGTSGASQQTKIINDDAKPSTGNNPPGNNTGNNPPGNNPPNNNTGNNPPATNNGGGQQQSIVPQVIYVPQPSQQKASSTATKKKAKAKVKKCKKGSVRKGKGSKAKCVKKKKSAKKARR